MGSSNGAELAPELWAGMGQGADCWAVDGGTKRANEHIVTPFGAFGVMGTPAWEPLHCPWGDTPGPATNPAWSLPLCHHLEWLAGPHTTHSHTRSHQGLSMQ